jgi:hypothetical protein
MFTPDTSLPWMSAFLLENLGTYHNEYVIFDAKQFTPGESLDLVLLWTIEQMLIYYNSAIVTLN